MNEVLMHVGADLGSLDGRTLLRLNSLSVNADLRLYELIETRVRHGRLSPERLDEVMVQFLVSKLERNVMDYDDLLLYWSQLLQVSPEVRSGVQGLFDAVFVDEYQDVNPLQVELIDALVEPHGQLTVVGDDRQSIYGFRGADVGAILHFEARYPDAQVLALESNYRSAGHIIELAEMSIAHNRCQRPVELKAVRSSGRPPVFCSVPDDDVQAEYVRERVEALLDYGVPPNEIAVLYRTHRQAQRLECALSAARIPYSVRSGQRFVEKPHVRRCLQFLSILADHQNVAQMAEGLEIFQGIGPVTANRLAARLTQRGWSGWITPDLMLEEPSLVARQASIEALGQCMRHLRELADQSLEAVVKGALERVVGPWIQRQYPDDASARFDECAQLIQRIRDAHHLSDFLASLALDDGNLVIRIIYGASCKGLSGLPCLSSDSLMGDSHLA